MGPKPHIMREGIISPQIPMQIDTPQELSTGGDFEILIHHQYRCTHSQCQNDRKDKIGLNPNTYVQLGCQIWEQCCVTRSCLVAKLVYMTNMVTNVVNRGFT